jgi:hypothetical protein
MRRANFLTFVTPQNTGPSSVSDHKVYLLLRNSKFSCRVYSASSVESSLHIRTYVFKIHFNSSTSFPCSAARSPNLLV